MARPIPPGDEQARHPARQDVVSESGHAGLNGGDCDSLLGDVFREFFDDDSLVLRPDMTARDIDGWDSLAHIRLLLTIERKFHIGFSAAEVGGLQTVGELTLLTGRKVDVPRR